MGWFILLGIPIVVVIVFPLVAYFILGPQNRWFTFVKEGAGKIIVRGDKFEKTLIQWEGCTFDYTKTEVEGKWQVIKGKEPWHLFGGFRLYSLFYPLFDVYVYHFRWTHLHEDGSAVTHDEWLDFVFLKEDLYVIEIPLREEGGAEDINGVPLGISVVIPMRIINPYIAVFTVRRWLPMITGTVQARLRRFVANYRYREDLLNMRAGENITEIQEKAGVPEKRRDKAGVDLWQKFWKQLETDFLQEGGEKKENELLQICGIVINKKKAGILKIDPSSKYRELTTLEYEAEQKKKRTIIEADAEKKRLETVAEGERARIETVYGQIRKFGDLGRLVRALEAMEKSPLAASMTVQAIPGIQEMLRGIFGKPPGAVSSQELRELKEMVEKLRKEKGG